MKLLLVNLKRLYQKPEMWGWYFLNGIIILMILLSVKDQRYLENRTVGWSLFVIPLLNLALVGSAMGRLTTDVWNKQMFFCLPGQNKTSAAMLSLIGLAVSIIIYSIMLSIFSWEGVGLFGGSILLISYYLMFYWLCLIMAIFLSKIVFVIPFFALFIPIITKYYNINYIFETSLFNHIWLYAFAFLMISCIIYYSLTRMSLLRFLSGPWPILSILWKNVRFKSETPSLKTSLHICRFPECIDDFFCRHIILNNKSIILPNIWGRVYIIFRFLISNYRGVLSVSLLVFFCALLFVNDRRFFDLQPYFFGLFGVLGGYMCIMPGSSIFLPINRKGLFFGGLTAFITSILLILILAAAFVLFSDMLAAATDLTSSIFFLRSKYVPFSGKYILLPLMVLPITAGLLLIFKNRLSLSLLSIIILALFLLGINIYMIDNENLFNKFNLYIYILITAISFIFYLATLYYDSVKRPIYWKMG